MRVIGEKADSRCKITFFEWNNKYLIKLELGLLEQTYKVPVMDLTGDNDLHAMLDDDFMNEAMERFKQMQQSMGKSFMRNNL